MAAAAIAARAGRPRVNHQHIECVSHGNLASGAGFCPVTSHSDDQVVSNEGYKVRPPSIKSVWPVMYAASSEHRNATTAAISSAPPARRIGMWASTMARLTGSSIQDRLIGVTVAP